MEIIYFTRNRIHHIQDLSADQLSYVDVTIVVSGSAQYTLNGTLVEVRAGDAIVFQPDDIRLRHPGGLCEYYSFNVIFDENDNVPRFNGVVHDCVTQGIRDLLKMFEVTQDSLSLYSQNKCICHFTAIYLSIYEAFESDKHNPLIIRIKNTLTKTSVGRSAHLRSAALYFSRRTTATRFSRNTRNDSDGVRDNPQDDDSEAASDIDGYAAHRRRRSRRIRQLQLFLENFQKSNRLLHCPLPQKERI